MAREPVTYDTALQKLGYTETATGLWYPLAGTFPVDGNGSPTGGSSGGGTTDPSGGTGDPVDLTTAAGRLGWGAPIGGDEFNYGTPAAPVVPDATLWTVYDSPGNGGNGLRKPSQAQVDGSKLTITGTAGSALTAGMMHKLRRTPGTRYEFRMRSYYTDDPTAPGNKSGGYHPLGLIWPSLPLKADGSDVVSWPLGGEYDILETGEPGMQAADGFMHHPSLDGADHQKEAPAFTVDLRQYVNVAFEWTTSGLRTWINGQDWYTMSGGAAADRKAIQAMQEGRFCFQLDAFQASGCIATKMEVDWLRIYEASSTPTGGGGGTAAPVIGPPLNHAVSVDTSSGSAKATSTYQKPGIGTATAFQIHELRKYPTSTLKATVPDLSRTSGVLNPGTYEYAIKAVDAAGNVSAFSNTVVVVVTATGATTSPGQPAGWDASGTGTGGSTTTDDPSAGGGDDSSGGGVAATTGAIPWTRTFRDGSKYNPPTGGDGKTAATVSSASALPSIANDTSITYTGPALTTTVTITGKSGFTLKNVALAAGGKLVVKDCSNYILDNVDLQYEPTSDATAGDIVALRGTGARAMVRNSMFGPSTYADHSSGVTATTQFLTVLDAMDHIYLDKVTFRNKSCPGNAFRIYGDTTQATGGCQYSVISQVLWTGCKPYKENDQEMARFGTSQMMQTDGYHIVEFCRAENVQTEPEVWSFKMNKSTLRGSTVVDCAGNPCLRHGNDGEFYDNYIVGDQALTNSTGSAVSSGGMRGYGRGHKVHHNTIRVNGTANYQRPILIDGGDTSPDALSNGHAIPTNWDVYANLLVKCGAPIVIGKNYATPPTGCSVHDNMIAECANAGSNGVMVVSGASAAGVAVANQKVFATAAAAGLTQGASGEWHAPAGQDFGARTPFITAAMAGKGATWDPWAGLASGGSTGGTTTGGGATGGTAGTTSPPSTGVSYPMDLMPDYWKLTLAIPSPSDSSTPMEIVKDGSPDLDTYVHPDYFRLNAAKDGIEMIAPYDGVSTKNSPNKRTEFREMGANGKTVLNWSTTSGRHILDVYTQVDFLQNNHCVIAQIHGASDDLTVFRLEGGTLWITDGDNSHGYQVLTGYQLGTAIGVKFDVVGSKVNYYVNDQKVPFTLAVSDSASYFKAGNYLQRKGASGSKTGVTLRRALITHS